MKEHLVNERDQILNCIYCNNERHITKWEKEFDGDMNYKTFKCECGARTRIRMKFMGDGNDNWDKNNPVELEERKASGKINELENLVSQVSEKKAA
tara:strand:- start:451 stop:738 length:288 start_codon:yes stop_codon:yes gene_type:complete